MIPRWRGEVIFRAMRSSATAAKSSKLWMCCSFTAALCQAGPNSPPPRMFASDVHAAAREPRRAEDAVVARDHRDLEAAVAVEQRRGGPVGLEALRPYDEVRDLRAVLRGRLELLGRHPLRVEECRHRLDLDRRRASFGEPEGLRRREVLVREEEGLRLVARGRQVRGAEPGRRDLGPRPCAAVVQGEGGESAAHVVERLEQDAVARAVHAGERNASARLEEHVEPARAAQQIAHRHRQQRALAVGLAAALGPVAAQREEQPVPEEPAGPGVLGQVDLDQPARRDRDTSPRGRTRESA